MSSSATLTTSSASVHASVRTGAWYSEHSLDLEFPPEWNVNVFQVETPPALTAAEIAEALNTPIGQPPLQEMCRGAKRPLIIVDDVNRPTPVDLIIPHLLRAFNTAGIPAQNVTVLLATGTHGQPRQASVLKKVGQQAASACKIVVHDANGPNIYVGKTRFNTPVLVNKEVTASDFVVGIGGLYPNHSAGYGGGSKLLLGVLGFQSILYLHYFHRNIGWAGASEQNTFRADLDELLTMLRVRSMVSVHADAERKPIRIACGDCLSYYKEERSFAQRIFTSPAPGDADVVIANAYPNDLSFTFALMKGAAPLYKGVPESSRIVIASCSEGLGSHGLFPVVNSGKGHILKNYLGLYRTMSTHAFMKKTLGALRRRLAPAASNRATKSTQSFNHPIWLYQPLHGQESLPARLNQVRISNSWRQIISGIEHEQKGRRHLKVAIYPCAPLVSLAAASDLEGSIQSL